MVASSRCARISVGGALLTVWFVAMLAVGAGLLARHLVAFPTPEKNAKLAASVEGWRSPAARGGWLALHVLYADCRCSQRIAEHLLSSSRPSDWSETVLWVGEAPPPLALEQRFDVRRMSAAELARSGLESAPMLIAADPQGGVRYAGGYTDRKQGPVIDDLRILEDARRTSLVASLPVFGCAVSERLQRQLRALLIP